MMPEFKRWCDEAVPHRHGTGVCQYSPWAVDVAFRLLPRNNANEVQRYCVNAPIQVTSSDILLMALRHINTWIGDYDGKVLMPLHDSGNFECPEEAKDEVATRIVADMEDAKRKVFGPDCIPFKVEVEYGYSLEESLLSSIDPDQELLDALTA